jgi:hypothetical protein
VFSHRASGDRPGGRLLLMALRACLVAVTATGCASHAAPERTATSASTLPAVETDPTTAQAAPAAGNATSVANAVVAAMKANDWPTLYSLADDSLRGGMTSTQFAEQVGVAVGAGTRVTDVHTTGSITYTTNQAGVSYANVPISLTVFYNGASHPTAGTLVLITDEGRWRWFTTKPAAS